MKYNELENIISAQRLQRYLLASNGNKAKALNYYRWNTAISLEMFAVVGAFEVALRNAIDKIMVESFGSDWLRDAILPNGIFDSPSCRDHARIIRSAYEKLMRQNQYTHPHLLSQMEFGIWKYMFATPQFRATNRILLKVFPNKPKTTRTKQYNHTFFFNELDHVNSLRNRIAHHEPICFPTGFAVIDTSYIRNAYSDILRLFSWMGIDGKSLLYGLDHVLEICDKIEQL